MMEKYNIFRISIASFGVLSDCKANYRKKWLASSVSLAWRKTKSTVALSRDLVFNAGYGGFRGYEDEKW